MKAKAPAPGKKKHVNMAPKPTLDGALAALHKHLGDKPLFMPPTRRHIPMRHKALAKMLGGEANPGMPTGTYIEVLGGPSAGKTTFEMACIDATINQPEGTINRVRTAKGIQEFDPSRRALVLDFERTLDYAYLIGAIRNAEILQTDDKGKPLNEDTANVWIHQPDVLEEGLEIAAQLIGCGGFDLLVIDSVPAMLPQAVRERAMTEPTVGKHAAAMAVFFQRLTAEISNRNVTVILINQWRDVIGAMPFQPQRRSPGGRSMEYFDSIKLDISGPKKSPWFPDGGKIANIRSLKNKVTGFDGQLVTYHIGVGFGLSAEVELTEALMQGGLVSSPGPNSPLVRLPKTRNERTYPNRMAWLQALRNDEKLFTGMVEACRRVGVVIGSPTSQESKFAEDA